MRQPHGLTWTADIRTVVLSSSTNCMLEMRVALCMYSTHIVERERLQELRALAASEIGVRTISDNKTYGFIQ